MRERFWGRVDICGSYACWEWQAGRFDNGYGRFWNGEREVHAHRFAYEDANGSIPSGHVVRHTCDNPGCVNPRHLIVGTQVDNIDDRQKSERQARGERHGMSKLTDNDIQTAKRLRAAGWSYPKLGARFGVHHTTMMRRLQSA